MQYTILLTMSLYCSIGIQSTAVRVNKTIVRLPYIHMVPLYMERIQVGSTMVAEIMYAKR